MEENKLGIVILGDEGVGKTCLISRFTLGCMGSGNPTNGVSCISKDINVNGINYLCEFWDVSGNKKYEALSKFYLRDSTNIIILVYDITKKISFIRLEKWLDKILEQLGDKAYLILVANKIDLYEDEEINEQTGRKFAEIIKAKFVVASSIEGHYNNWNSFLENEIKNYIKERVLNY